MKQATEKRLQKNCDPKFGVRVRGREKRDEVFHCEF